MGFGDAFFNPRATRKSADRRGIRPKSGRVVRWPDAIVRQPAGAGRFAADGRVRRLLGYGAGSSAMLSRTVPVAPTVIRRRTVVGSVHTGWSPASPRTSGGDHTTRS